MAEYDGSDFYFEDDVQEVYGYLDFNNLTKILNKLTDYAEILTEGKLSGIINYNYNLSSHQTNSIVDFLLKVQVLSKINNIAAKGSKDLEEEYISNLVSDTTNPSNISSYISIRNSIENRLNHQTQQYNMNMNKNNTTMSMPINELRGHVKTYNDLTKDNITVSKKAYHGLIAASLHDAYVTMLNRKDWWNDRTYQKFFFNDDDATSKKFHLFSKLPVISLNQISLNIFSVVDRLKEIKLDKVSSKKKSEELSISLKKKVASEKKSHNDFNDKMLETPFGKQYGHKIDEILTEIFESSFEKEQIDDDLIRKDFSLLYKIFMTLPNSLDLPVNRKKTCFLVDNLMGENFSLKEFADFYLNWNKQDLLYKNYNEEVKSQIESFLLELFVIYFNEKFISIFRIIKSLDMKKFACAYIIKRIYLLWGGNLTRFGYFLLKAIAHDGKIKG